MLGGRGEPDAGYECIEVAARAAIAADEWGSAAAALNEFVNRVPNHIPALMRLVEICVDGGLEATMHSAQAQLADAYLIVGAGTEARVIAEDLVAREPWDRSNIERFRRALALLGETDIDAIIAERLSGQSPFTSTDFLWPADPGGIGDGADARRTPTRLRPHRCRSTPRRSVQHVDDAGAIDIEQPAVRLRVSGARSTRAGVRVAGSRSERRASRSRQDRRQRGPSPTGGARRSKNVLKGLRDEAAHDASPETAEQHFKLAATYVDMGMQEEAMKALEVAARSPRHRFRAGAMLAKAYLDAGDQAHAIEWYERAVEAPAPSPMAHHALLYELASVLEAQRREARALAVLLELQAEAGEYRDMSKRLEQLKVQMGS